jgi:uncharacterized integral membrane protein
MKMKARKPAALQAVCIYLFLSFFLLPVTSRGQSFDSLQWGATIEGLQMSIFIAGSTVTNVREVQVAFLNTAEKDATLILGIMLAY